MGLGGGGQGGGLEEGEGWTDEEVKVKDQQEDGE